MSWSAFEVDVFGWGEQGSSGGVVEVDLPVVVGCVVVVGFDESVVVWAEEDEVVQ